MIMNSKFFIRHKIAKFQNVKVVTKIWKAQMVLPFRMCYKVEEENERKSVWLIRVVLN
jgi:hypothetical protein